MARTFSGEEAAARESRARLPGGAADLEIHIGKRAGERGYPVLLRLDGVLRCDHPGYLNASLLPWIETVEAERDGAQLFERLFADERLRITWAQLAAEAPQRHVRLVIDAGAPELHMLPWELLRDPGDENPGFLAASAASPFSRFLAVAGPPGKPADARRIKVLLAIANPFNLTDFGLPAIDAEQEAALLREALAGQGTVQMSILPSPCTLAGLARELQNGYEVLHFIGHGVLGDAGAMLVMADDDNRVQRVGGDELAGLIAQQSPDRPPGPASNLRLVFLASCQSAARSIPAYTGTDAYLGLAPRLVRAGVPAVVAMQRAVRVDTAQRFSAAFYRRLVRHGLVDLAANEARAVVLAARLPGAAIPVLFMRLKGGRLFDAALTPHEERAYLDLVQQAFGHWQELYVPQEAMLLPQPGTAKSARWRCSSSQSARPICRGVRVTMPACSRTCSS